MDRNGPDGMDGGMDGPGTSWADVRAWRRTQRQRLLTRRTGLDRDTRAAARTALGRQIRESFPWLKDHTIGFYWPIQGEPDLRRTIRDFLAEGAAAALPVVVEKRRPVEFWAWRPEMRMVPGDWNIPQPPVREPVRPTALLVPLLGFGGFYRLGYGAGYYDRTLAALDPRPWAIGVGLELGRLPTIHPQPHDVPMDAIVTETGVTRGARLDAA